MSEIKEENNNEVIDMIDELDELKERENTNNKNNDENNTNQENNNQEDTNQENTNQKDKLKEEDKMKDEIENNDENNDENCPYLDGNISINNLTLYNKTSLTEDFKKIIPNKIKHMNTILTIYKFIFMNYNYINSITNNNHITNNNEVSNEFNTQSIQNLDFSKLFDEKKLNKNLNSFKVQQKKILAYKKLLDLCFSYFIWLIDNSAPFIQYTSNRMKYILITNTIQLNKFTNKIINELISKIIEFFNLSYDNKFIQELIKNNSVYISFDYDLNDVIIKMNNELTTITKNLINNIINLDNEIMKIEN
jgi:hypothetical protein